MPAFHYEQWMVVPETASFSQQILLQCQDSSVVKEADVPWKAAILARVFGQLSSFKKAMASIIKGPKDAMPTGAGMPSAAKRLDMVIDCCFLFQADVNSLNTHKGKQV